mmetsp:Transcript_15790/g.37944  ORF Transcript_15790/g.37944 Transcript_15790/m.37944 type:complete len:86 (-) Transcript_15790:276-533(-)
MKFVMLLYHLIVNHHCIHDGKFGVRKLTKDNLLEIGVYCFDVSGNAEKPLWKGVLRSAREGVSKSESASKATLPIFLTRVPGKSS